MKPKTLSLGIAAALCSMPLLAAEPDAPGQVPLQYVGANTRVALGIDRDADVQGELLHVFGYDGRSAWLAQGWLGEAGAGGLQLGYHWLWDGKSRDDTLGAGEGITVGKVFAAIDQNPFDDRKASIGWGMERQHFSLDAYVSGAVTGERLTDTFVTRSTRVNTGTQGGRPFRQEETTVTTTRVFERPYDWGVGLRVGRFFDQALVRLRGGVDYEWGEFDSDQVAVSVGMDKYIANSGHSVALDLEHARHGGDFALGRSDTRAWLTWRYEWGESFRAAQPYRTVEHAAPAVAAAAPEAPAAPPGHVVRNEAQMGAESFFALDRAQLDPAAQESLRTLVGALQSDRRVSRIRITGHTCDLGPAAYNQRLSERRAEAVKAFLLAQGIPAEEMDVSGAGETEPKYPNDAENRPKNRRVDVSFLTLEAQEPVAPQAPPAEQPVRWVREPVAVPAAWIERALRNPAQHKRTVDVYRVVTSEQQTELGPIEYVNRGPVAVDDSGTTAQDTSIAIPVLANDSDPDGDRLLIVSTTTPAHGTVTIAGTSVQYVPQAGFTGSDSFTYTITDGSATATARVTVTVTATPVPAVNRPPVAVDDHATTPARDPVTIRVMANDSDPDGDPIRVVEVSQPNLGTTTINPDGTILFTPRSDWCGRSVFVYTISDPAGLRASARVIVERFVPAPGAKLCNG